MTVNIYRIYSHIGDLQYFGSTTQDVIRRYREHINAYNINKKETTSRILFDTYGTVNTFVELVETCEEDNRNERESWWIRNNECVNKLIPDRTRLEYDIKNRDSVNTHKREYRKENYNVLLAREREYYEKNRDAINARMREYREKNRDAINARRRKSRALKKSKSES